MVVEVVKRDGRVVPYDKNRIIQAIIRAALAVTEDVEKEIAADLADHVTWFLNALYGKSNPPTVEQVQDTVEKVLIENGHAKTAKAYILYRAERNRTREMNNSLMKTYEDLTFKYSKDMDLKRENANINTDTAMGTMLKYGSEGAKKFNHLYLLDKEASEAHLEGDIHIHDLDFYGLTETCCQTDLNKLFDGGFSTGHGYLREPNDIRSYGALACIAIQSNQNDQHGGQSIPAFDHYLAPGVAKTMVTELVRVADTLYDDESVIDELKAEMKKVQKKHTLVLEGEGKTELRALIKEYLGVDDAEVERIWNQALKFTTRDTEQSMEAVVHNLNSMHSRAGSQVPFSSINYGTCTSEEGRMVIKGLLLATWNGLGNGEIPIFPIQIWKMKSGVSVDPGDPNEDLFKLACKVSAKRMFPNFSNLDAPYNAQYLKDGDINTEVAYMGCRTRVIGNAYDPSREIVTGRGNLSFTSINLPRLAIKAGKGNIAGFYTMLDEMMLLVKRQLLKRMKLQMSKCVYNYPFLMGQGNWIDSDKLGYMDEVGDILKHGSLSIGFIGLAETLIALTGKHHGESAESQALGLEIIGHMRETTDKWAKEEHLNWGILATPAEGLSSRFTTLDKRKYKTIPGVTDKDYYTNSFHIPVYYEISAYEKLEKEAPYHALTNAGHISYVEMDGDPLKNLEAFEDIVRAMHKLGIGYGAINHAVDRDPVCGYTGIIDDVCPRCGRRDGEGITEEKLEELKKRYKDIPCCR